MSIQRIDRKRAITPETRTKLAVVSFKMMRKWVGILGISIVLLLPLINYLFGGCTEIQPSISHYYYTIAGSLFVGLLCVIGFFLIIYPGNGLWEDLPANIAGMLAIAVALFPTGLNGAVVPCAKASHIYHPGLSTAHLLAAGLFFIILGYVAIFQFPTKLKGKKWRDFFYKLCGILMWLSIAAIAPMTFSDSYSDFLNAHKLVFFLEVLAVLAFGFSWLVKGFELEQEYSG